MWVNIQTLKLLLSCNYYFALSFYSWLGSHQSPPYFCHFLPPGLTLYQGSLQFLDQASLYYSLGPCDGDKKQSSLQATWGYPPVSHNHLRPGRLWLLYSPFPTSHLLPYPKYQNLISHIHKHTLANSCISKGNDQYYYRTSLLSTKEF